MTTNTYKYVIIGAISMFMFHLATVNTVDT